jgi:hypothetical protein
MQVSALRPAPQHRPNRQHCTWTPFPHYVSVTLAQVQAPEHELAAVTSWLDVNDIPYKLSKTRHIIEAEAPVAAIEALLHCQLCVTTPTTHTSCTQHSTSFEDRYVFRNKIESERVMVRKMGPFYLPLELAGIIRAVFNLAGASSSRVQRDDVPHACGAPCHTPHPCVQSLPCRAKAACPASHVTTLRPNPQHTRSHLHTPLKPTSIQNFYRMFLCRHLGSSCRSQASDLHQRKSPTPRPPHR